MELNREQLIKGLESCTNRSCGVDCPYYEAELCQDAIMRDALSLIKELTEENERLRAEKEAVNKEAFYKWKKLADETADRYEGLYQDAKKSLVADTVRKMQERLVKRFKGDKDNVYTVYNIHRYIDQIAKEMLEGEDGKAEQ